MDLLTSFLSSVFHCPSFTRGRKLLCSSWIYTILSSSVPTPEAHSGTSQRGERGGERDSSMVIWPKTSIHKDFDMLTFDSIFKVIINKYLFYFCKMHICQKWSFIKCKHLNTLHVMNWTVFPPKSYLEALTPHVTGFGERASKEVTEVEWGHRVEP